MKGGSHNTAIIITGRKRGGPRQLADYLMDKGENEAFWICEINCFVAKNIKDALAEMWAVAEGSKAKDFMYHATVNPRSGVTLSEKQWKETIDALENKLNLVGHQRVVVEHTKKGRTHRHVVWNRVDPDTGLVKKLSFDRRKLRSTAVELTEKFGLTPTPNVGQSYKRGEIERGQRTGIGPKLVKAEVTVLWNQSKSGQEFAARLAKRGYILARGDKSQFVIIDRAGSIHGLTRRIEGANAKAIKRGMADIDINTLPTIKEAKAQVKARQPKYGGSGKGNAKIKKNKLYRPYRKRGTTTKRYRTKHSLTSPAKAWRHYGFYQTSRSLGSKTIGNANSLSAVAQKDQSVIVPTTAFKDKTKTGAPGTIETTTPPLAKDYPAPQKTSPAVGSQNHGAAPLIPMPKALTPAVPSVGNTIMHKSGKQHSHEYQQHPVPFRPASTSGMSEAQRIDLEAALEGKITWAEYYRKWGRGGEPSL